MLISWKVTIRQHITTVSKTKKKMNRTVVIYPYKLKYINSKLSSRDQVHVCFSWNWISSTYLVQKIVLVINEGRQFPARFLEICKGYGFLWIVMCLENEGVEKLNRGKGKSDKKAWKTPPFSLKCLCLKLISKVGIGMIEMHTHKPIDLAGNVLALCKETVK